MIGSLVLALVLPVAKVSEQVDVLKATYPGKLTTIAKVEVKPQVTGEIIEVCFENGQTVKEGDILYRLDPVKYEAAVKNAEARVVEMRANVAYAERSYERHKRLLETRAVSLDAVDNALSQRDSSRAAFAAAKAELLSAEDDLAHCTIRAPISGKIGSTAKTKGNYVTAGELSLVSIVQFDPVRATFSVSNRELLDFKTPGGEMDKSDIEISLRLANGTIYEGNGELEYTENQSDELTDTLMLVAKFENANGILVPGGVVSVNVSSKKGKKRPAIPPQAVLQDTQGPYVYVLDAENRAQRRSIARGDLVGDWLFIEKGLEIGERIVADGAHRVKRGEIIEEAKTK
ncbi:MAG: efflux RND transporter periplasmic adaptor subunit [Kiritimatiellae bacterium]|nr:efflux RND transporter periplasmic adaptor subunit [Kiritimatiellia bacterium]